jgi:hypothetical protein
MLYRIFETSTMEARSDFQWALPPELFSKGKPITHANSVNFLTLVESVTNCQAPRRYVASYRLNGDLLHCLSGRRSLMATRLLSAAAGGGKTAQGCALFAPMHKLLAAVFSVARRRQPLITSLVFPLAAAAVAGGAVSQKSSCSSEPGGF